MSVCTLYWRCEDRSACVRHVGNPSRKWYNTVWRFDCWCRHRHNWSRENSDNQGLFILGQRRQAAKSTRNAECMTRSVMHRERETKKLSWIKNTVTHYRWIVKNDESKWSRRHTIDTIPDDWRQKNDLKWTGTEKKNIRHLLLLRKWLHQSDNDRSEQFIKKKNRFYFICFSCCCIVQLHSCSSCAFQNSNPSKK